MKKTTRWEWADIAKGLSILLIVLIHTGEGFYSSTDQSPAKIWVNLHDLGYTFMVPVFFLLSGWFSQNSSKSISIRLRSIVTNILYPYVLWSIMQAILIIASGAGNNNATWSDIPGILLNGWMQFWFLHCLILIMLIDVALRLLSTPYLVRLVGALATISILIYGYNFPWKLTDVAEHLIFFEIGVGISILSRLKKTPINAYLLALSAAILLILSYTNGAGYEQPLRPLGATFGILLCLSIGSIISKSNNIVSFFLVKCGNYSLQIYLVHIIIAAALRVLLFKFGIESFATHLILGFSLSVLGSIVIARADELTLNFLFRFPTTKNNKPAIETRDLKKTVDADGIDLSI